MRVAGVPVDPLVLDEPELLVEVLEEGHRTKEEHVRAREPLEAFLLRVQARKQTCSFAQIGAEAAQEDDVPDAALADGLHDCLALLPLPREVVRRPSIGREQRVDGVGAAKGLRQEGGVRQVAGEHVGPGALERRELALRSTERADLLDGLEQSVSDLPSGVSRCAHHGNHVVLLYERQYAARAGE